MSITQYTIFNDTITKKMYNKRNKIVFFFKSVMHAKTLQKYYKNISKTLTFINFVRKSH